MPKFARSVTGGSPPTRLDVRWTLGGPSGAAKGRIPGAVSLPATAHLTGPGRWPDPDRPVATGEPTGEAT